MEICLLKEQHNIEDESCRDK